MNLAMNTIEKIEQMRKTSKRIYILIQVLIAWLVANGVSKLCRLGIGKVWKKNKVTSIEGIER